MRTFNRRSTVLAWIVIAGFAALWTVLGARALPQGRASDFLSFYTGAYLASHGSVASLYDPAAQFAIQRNLLPSTVELVPFLRPPFYALLLAPLTRLPFGAAFIGWILLQTGIFLACLGWAWRRFGTVALLCGSMSLPAALGIAHAQDTVAFLGVVIVSYLLVEKGRDLAAGAVLGLLLVKFHLAPLWLVGLILHRRWKMLAGFFATGSAAAAVSLAMVGVGGARAYAALLQNRNLEWLTPSPELTISFQGLAANLGIATLAGRAGLVAAAVGLLLAAVLNAPMWRVYAASTVASLLAVPHVYGYDAALLLLPLWLAAFHAALRPTKLVTLWLFTSLPFASLLAGKPWAAAASLSLLAFAATLAGEGVATARKPQQADESP